MSRGLRQAARKYAGSQPATVWIAVGAVIVCGLLITGLTARLLADVERQRQRAMLASSAEQAMGEIVRRFGRHEVQLRAAQALFKGSTFVSRRDWNAFAQVFLPSPQEAGFFEMAWLPRVPTESLDSIVDQARSDGLDSFVVFPPTKRDFHCPILYNEPQERHPASLGRDACINPTAYPAMQRARTERRIALSEPLQLGATGEALHPGYVMFAWVEGNERQKGWVAGTVTARELFDASLVGQSLLSLTVFDSSSSQAEGVVFHRGRERSESVGGLEVERKLTLGGRNFRARFVRSATPALAPPLALSTGTVITLLLAGFLLTLLRARTRALHLAESMTRAYRESEELLSSITNNVQEGIYRGNPDKGLVYVNQALAEMFGFESPESMKAHPGPMLYASPRQREKLRDLLEQEGQYRNQEVAFIRRDGSQFVGVNSAAATRDEEGRLRHFDGVVMDITERKRAEEEVHRLAHYDSLTDLPNRTLFQTRIDQVLEQARRRQRPFAVMFLDLDRFKMVNDSLGHGVGDHLLTAVARRLSSKTRDYDLISRQSGDEFLLVLPDMDADNAARKAENLVRDFAEHPFEVNGHKLTVTPSIGISMFPGDADDAETLIRNADAAMYHAKERGRSTFQFFTEELNARVHERLTMENHLRGALTRKELSLAFQPVVNLSDGRITGLEALLRWHSARLGQIPPSDFIPVAEQSGLIVEIGDWVIETACRQIAQWRKQGHSELTVAVNVSAVQFWRGNLGSVVREALARWRVPPSQLVVELTESVIMQDAEAARGVLTELKRLGIGLAIDDFGTGYSSLGYLKQFRIDLLKIDRTFIRDVDSNSDDAAIVAAILSVAKDLRMQVVAEGIERHEQLAHMQSRGCQYGQGFLFSRPVPVDEVSRLIEHWTPPIDER